MADNKTEPLENLSLKKSNEMISAKYQSTLLENQVMSIAFTRIEVNNKDERKPLEARLYPGELKKLIGDPSHIYRNLRAISKTITGHSIVIEDGKGNFNVFSIVNNARYENGVFIIKFNEDLKNHISGLEKNYTTLELSVLANFKRNSSFRIYELLKKEIYKSRPDVNDGVVCAEYNISELKFMIGLANIENKLVKNEMARMDKHIDWDVLYEKLDKRDRKYEEWREFQRCVIKVAQEELKEKSNIQFDYEPIREGRKIKRILFKISPNNPAQKIEILKRQKVLEKGKQEHQYKQAELLVTMNEQLFIDMIGHNGLTEDDIKLLLEKSGYEEDKVRNAIQMADEQEYISNYMGWLIKCIENDYVSTKVSIGSEEVAATIDNLNKEISTNDSIHQKYWNKVKAKADFVDFVEALNKEAELTLEQFEAISSDANEMVQVYTRWRTGKGIEL